MSGRRRRPAPRAAAIIAAPARVGAERSPAQVNRAIDDLAATLDRAVAAAAGEGHVDVDLVVGTNRIGHGLGRTPARIDVMPFEASSSFGWGFDPGQPGNPHPERVAVIEVTGAPMTARVSFF